MSKPAIMLLDLRSGRLDDGGILGSAETLCAEPAVRGLAFCSSQTYMRARRSMPISSEAHRKLPCTVAITSCLPTMMCPAAQHTCEFIRLGCMSAPNTVHACIGGTASTCGHHTNSAMATCMREKEKGRRVCAFWQSQHKRVRHDM